jgi:hypothetical protein
MAHEGMDKTLKALHGLILPMQKAQKALTVLRNMGLRLDGYELLKNQSMIMIPLARRPSEPQNDILRRELGTFQIQQVPFERKVSRPKSLQEGVAGHVPSHLISILPDPTNVCKPRVRNFPATSPDFLATNRTCGLI